MFERGRRTVGSIAITNVSYNAGSVHLGISHIDRSNIRSVIPHVLHIVHLNRSISGARHFTSRTLRHTCTTTHRFTRILGGRPISNVHFITASTAHSTRGHRRFRSAVRRVLNIHPRIVPNARRTSLDFLNTADIIHHSIRTPCLIISLNNNSARLILNNSNMDRPGARIRTTFSVGVNSIHVARHRLGGSPPARTRVRRTVTSVSRRVSRTFGAIPTNGAHAVVNISNAIAAVATLTVKLARCSRSTISNTDYSLRSTCTISGGFLAVPHRRHLACGAVRPNHISIINNNTLI